jgi:hypothetical protein
VRVVNRLEPVGVPRQRFTLRFDLRPPIDALQRPAALPQLKFARNDAIAVAVMVTSPIDHPADVALRLGSLAIEQDVEVIVFCTLDYSGLERFGFRTEKVAGETETQRDACLDQLRQFWNIELTLPIQ